MTEEWNKIENRRVNMLVLLTLLSYLVGSVCASFVNDSVVQLVMIQAFCLAPGLLSVIVFREKNESFGRAFAETYRVHRIRISVVLLSALMMLFLMPLLTLINLISQEFTNYVAAEDIMERIIDYPFPVTLLCIGIIPAIGEELTYRGLMYGHYRKRSALMGALLTGLIFGMMHGNLNQMTYAFAMGFVFAMVDEATGSTVSSMVMHALVNCGSVVIIYIVKWTKPAPGSESAFSSALDQAVNETVTLTPQLLVGYGVAAVIGTYFAYRIYREIAYRCCTEVQIRGEVRKPGKLRALLDMFTAPLVVALVVLAALVVATELKL